MKRNPPFFILGCVRSGTTMLRNILRMHPNLAAPEETHFYRWTDPFGTEASIRQLCNNATLKKHRQIDGIGEDEFRRILDGATSRRELYVHYMRRYIEGSKPDAGRWFDKTPQNVYGAAMIASDFPGSRFIHIVRNPLDVVLSLRAGEVMRISNLVGACNSWREAIASIATLKRAYPKRVFEFHYEAFNKAPKQFAGQLLDFVGEPYDPAFMDAFQPKPKTYDHAALLTAAEREVVRTICGKWAADYGYAI